VYVHWIVVLAEGLDMFRQMAIASDGRIFSDYVDRRGGDSLTTRFGEEVILKRAVLHHLFSKPPN
jgi:hypothetical protein